VGRVVIHDDVDVEVWRHPQLGSDDLALDAVSAAQDAGNAPTWNAPPVVGEPAAPDTPAPPALNQRYRRPPARVRHAALPDERHSIRCDLLRFQMTRA
jgi:hypothetical protein